MYRKNVSGRGSGGAGGDQAASSKDSAGDRQAASVGAGRSRRRVLPDAESARGPGLRRAGDREARPLGVSWETGTAQPVGKRLCFSCLMCTDYVYLTGLL